MIMLELFLVSDEISYWDDIDPSTNAQFRLNWIIQPSFTLPPQKTIFYQYLDLV